MITKEYINIHNNSLITEKNNAKKQTHEQNIVSGFQSISTTNIPYNQRQKNLLYEKITTIFMAIGIPAHVRGYHYLREAIQLALSDFEMHNCIMKELYPKVARRFNTNVHIVERAIRNAIEIACNRGKIMNLNTIFGIAIFERNDKPTNSELIALLTEKLYIECQ